MQVLDPKSDTIRTLAGSGKPGLADGSGTTAQLSEPGGLCLGPAGTVLVADTNNSLIRCCCIDPCSVDALSFSAWLTMQHEPNVRSFTAVK